MASTAIQHASTAMLASTTRATHTRSMPRLLRHITAITCAMLFSAASIQAATIHVPADYADVQSAINASVNGDIIEIAAGTYSPPTALITNGKAITLRGALNKVGTPLTMLDGAGNKPVLLCVNGEGSTTRFENLVIRNGASYDGGGMYCIFTSPTLVNCTFQANIATNFGGGLSCLGSSPALIGCNFEANTAAFGGGVYCTNSSNPTLTDCTFEVNTATNSGGGMYSALPVPGSSASNPTVTNSVFCGNTATNSPQFFGSTWINGGGNCFAFDCSDADGDGSPDQCGQIDDGMHHVPSEYASIDAAIAACGNGDTVVIAAGTYFPAVTLNPFGKQLTLRGAVNVDGSPASILDGAGNKRVLRCESGEGPTTRFENLVIRNGSASLGGGMSCLFSSPTLSNCTFETNTTNSNGGAMYCFYASPTLTNCTFAASAANSYGGGLYCSGSSSPTLTNCTFEANAASSGGGGMYCKDSSNPTMTNCMFEGNTAPYGGGMYCTASSPELRDCTFAANIASSVGGGMYCDLTSDPTIMDSIFCSNTAPSGAQISSREWIDAGGNCFAYSCSDSDGDGRPNECEQVGDGIHHVPSEYTTIESAIAACGNGDTILVAAGTYFPAATLNPLGKLLTLRGSVSADGTLGTVLDGAGNKMVLRCNNGEGSATRFENLIIRNGSAGSGGGMFCYLASPALTNCRFEENTAGNGGGMACFSSSPTLTNCTFRANSSNLGGGMYCTGSNPTLTNCIIEANTAVAGAGMKVIAGSPTLTNCILVANTATSSAGGLYCFGGTATPTLTRCLLCSNTAPNGSQIFGSTWIDGGENCISTDCITCDGDGDGVSNTLDNCPAIANADQMDCDSNGIGDVCQIAVDPSLDCDNSSTLDSCDITNGEADIDNDGTLDSCEYLYGDFDLNGIIDAPDLAFLLSIWELPDQPIGDITGDGLVNAADLAALLSRWGRVP